MRKVLRKDPRNLHINWVIFAQKKTRFFRRLKSQQIWPLLRGGRQRGCSWSQTTANHQKGRGTWTSGAFKMINLASNLRLRCSAGFTAEGLRNARELLRLCEMRDHFNIYRHQERRETHLRLVSSLCLQKKKKKKKDLTGSRVWFN